MPPTTCWRKRPISDEALSYEDRSIQIEERYDNLMTRSQVLDAMGRKDESKT